MDTNLSDLPTSTTASKVNGYGSSKTKSSLLIKQQTEIYEDVEDDEYKEYIDDGQFEQVFKLNNISLC